MKKGSELNSSASQELDQGSKESLMAGVRDCIGSVIGFLEEFHEDQRGSVEINRHRIMGILGILTVVCMFGGGVCKPENPYAAADALIQVKGLNSGHIAKLNEMGITLPKSAINNIFVDELFPEGVKGYPHFKRTVMDALQPKEIACADTGAFECGRTRAENTAAILSYCALGRHQILLSYHGHYIKGWEDADWNRRLILIHRFMASPRMQNTVFVGILGELKDKYDGDPKQMASAYYSGSGTGGWCDPWTLAKSFLPSQYNFPSKQEYSSSVAKAYKKATGKKKVETQGDLKAFAQCVTERESGWYTK